MQRKTKFILSVIILLVILIAGYFIRDKCIESMYKRGFINKNIYLLVKENDTIDYKCLENGSKLSAWNLHAKKKMIKYMKWKKLKIAPGEYHFEQGTPYKEVRDILKFEPITKD